MASTESPPSPPPTPTASPACCRGLLKLLGTEGQELTESTFIRACGSRCSRQAMRAEIAELARRGVLERRPVGRGARLRVQPQRTRAVLEHVLAGLSPRARIAGSVVLPLVQRLLRHTGNGAEPPAAATRTSSAPPEHSEPDTHAPSAPPAKLDEARVLATVAGLWRRQPHGAMVSIPELLEALGLDRLDELAPVLLRLARARQLRLEPISDPLGLPAAERAFVIHDRVKGELFYITPGTASSPARRP